MINLLKAELYRAKFFKSIWIGLIVVFGLTVINILVANSLTNAAEGSEFLYEYMGLAYSGKSVILGGVSATDTTFLLGIIISLIVGGSFQNGAMRNATVCGSKRINVYFTFFIETLFLSLVYVVANFVIAGVLSPIVGYGVDFTGKEFGILIGRMCLQFLCVVAYSSVFLMLSMLIRKSGAAIGLSIGFYIVENLIISAIVVAATFADNVGLLNFTNAFLSTCLTTASDTGALEAKSILICTFVPIAWIILSSLVSILAFEKRDL